MGSPEITTAAAAAILGVSRRQVGRLIQNGILPARKISAEKNSAHLIDYAAVLAYQQSDRRRGPKNSGNGMGYWHRRTQD